MTNERFSYLGFALVVSGSFAVLTFLYLTGMPIRADGGQNTLAAYYLVHSGVISTIKNETKTPKPTMAREPLPIVVTASFLLLHPSFNEPYAIADLTTWS
jgi:hypothetical protein